MYGYAVHKLYFWEQNMNMFFQKGKTAASKPWRQISFITSFCYTRALKNSNNFPKEFPWHFRGIGWKMERSQICVSPLKLLNCLQIHAGSSGLVLTSSQDHAGIWSATSINTKSSSARNFSVLNNAERKTMYVIKMKSQGEEKGK